jgi:hypothetical protein
MPWFGTTSVVSDAGYDWWFDYDYADISDRPSNHYRGSDFGLGQNLISKLSHMIPR